MEPIYILGENRELFLNYLDRELVKLNRKWKFGLGAAFLSIGSHFMYRNFFN